MAGSLIELEVIHEIFETLVAMDENYNARPMLASKVETSNEAKTYTFGCARASSSATARK